LKRYNLRVYALIINDNNEVLVSDERRHGRSFTKFPGGGLEWGEGLKDGLVRELSEELAAEKTKIERNLSNLCSNCVLLLRLTSKVSNKRFNA